MSQLCDTHICVIFNLYGTLCCVWSLCYTCDIHVTSIWNTCLNFVTHTFVIFNLYATLSDTHNCHVYSLCYTCDIHVTPMWYTHQVSPFVTHIYHNYSTFMTHLVIHMIIVFNGTHVIHMWHTCDTEIRSHLCETHCHISPLWHIWWYTLLCLIFVIHMWYTCDIHVMYTSALTFCDTHCHILPLCHT